jgi:3-oxoacyl-[acyl-carrier-protein] synthase-1/3-oxoacyl-[acyl-carrier-protein] synthase II
MKRSLPVAITGIGCLSAAGADLPATLPSLYAGERQPMPYDRSPRHDGGAHVVFQVRADLPAGEPGAVRTTRLALAAAAEALADAGLTAAELGRRRVGVCIGTNVGGAMSNEDYYDDSPEGCIPHISPQHRFLSSSPTMGLIREYGLSGPSQTVVNACSAGADAIGLAASWIRSGICDCVIAGGTEEMSQATYLGFISLMISDTSPCRPFDRRRNGLNLGEGAAVVILESESSIEGRGGSPRASLLGYGASADAFHHTAPDPTGHGLKLAIGEAMAASGMTAGGISFVNAHGTGTADNDRIESRVLAEMLPGAPFLSTKGYTGHTLGASGAIEAALTVAFLEQGRLPASIGFEEKDPELPCAPVAGNTPIEGSVALSQTLAFGGNNAVLVLKKEDRRP